MNYLVKEMKTPSNVLLIRPPLPEGEESPGIPLGVMYISSVLKQKGFKTKIIDYTVEHNVNIRKIIDEYKPQMVGISVTWSLQALNALKIAKSIRGINKNILLIAGGNPVTIAPQDFLDVFDIAVRGEGEMSILEIASGKKLNSIKGISYKEKGKIKSTPMKQFNFNLDSLPYPDYDAVDLEKYFNPFLRINFFQNVTSKRKIGMITSRGCPFSCFFCSIRLHMGQYWRPHSAEYVLNHLEMLKKKYNIEHVNFDDDNLTFNPKRFEAILDGMKKRGIKITWDTPNGVRLDTLNRRLLRKMKASGLVRLTIAIESGSQEFIDNIMHKRINLDNAVEIAKICKEEGIPLTAFYIIGMPGETKADIEKTLNFAYMLLKKYGVIPRISIGTLLPGIEMTKICEENNYIKNGRIQTDQFTVEDIDKYYRDFGRKLIIPFLIRLNWITVAKNIGKFPKMALRVWNPRKAYTKLK
jgi:anaerobic magnesium-protoporphyrin IX monomethyl ester cyclase